MNRTIPMLALALLLIPAAPSASANTGVCTENLFNFGYAECWGLADRCYGGGTLNAGVGQWYYGPNGWGATGCTAYAYEGYRNGYVLLGACVEATTYHVDCFGRITGAGGLSCIGSWQWDRQTNGFYHQCLV